MADSCSGGGRRWCLHKVGAHNGPILDYIKCHYVRVLTVRRCGNTIFHWCFPPMRMSILPGLSNLVSANFSPEMWGSCLTPVAWWRGKSWVTRGITWNKKVHCHQQALLLVRWSESYGCGSCECLLVMFLRVVLKVELLHNPVWHNGYCGALIQECSGSHSLASWRFQDNHTCHKNGVFKLSKRRQRCDDCLLCRFRGWVHMRYFSRSEIGSWSAKVRLADCSAAVQRMSFPAASCVGLCSVSEWSRLYSIYWCLVPSRLLLDQFWLGCSEGGSRWGGLLLVFQEVEKDIWLWYLCYVLGEQQPLICQILGQLGSKNKCNKWPNFKLTCILDAVENSALKQRQLFMGALADRWTVHNTHGKLTLWRIVLTALHGCPCWQMDSSIILMVWCTLIRCFWS